MLRFTIILIISLLTQISNAQTYVPFPTSADTTIWLQEIGIVTSPPPYIYELFIEGDTIINNKAYSKIYSGDYNHTTSYYQKAIREEGKIVYLWDDSTEVILYDFNAQLGDTIVWFGANDIDKPYIHTVDSVMIDGAYRKRYEVASQSSSVSIIEGIGSDTGLFPKYYSFGDYRMLICFTLNNQTIYTAPNHPNCITSTNQIKQEDNISIYPNPTSDNLNIEFENTEQRELMIFNQLGQQVLNEISNETTVILNLEQLPKGFYVLTIRTQKGTFTKKIIKH